VLNTIEKTGLLAHCREVGKYFQQQLEKLRDRHKTAIEVRGRGLLLGLALTVPGAPIVDACRDKGFIINCIQESVLRFAPPLVITTDDIDRLINCLDEILTDLDKK
jgi:acetylornithine/N-succinyldiaminopimelate aminotransferase